jgi:hypothetical protein
MLNQTLCAQANAAYETALNSPCPPVMAQFVQPLL